MALSDDLINFDIIETQKENIQSLPQGRSAKALASAFGPTPFSPVPTPGSTRNLNDAIRAEYEKELQNIGDSDDPLDVYDRYVKWTLNAYPSSQATPESQLRPLLERATKAFQSVVHYKNDPRYLKLWIHYIRFFSDAPREAFAYLSRHGIGEGLALFYEEFAAWLENAGRWRQAEEAYQLGIEREARPTERLSRKFGEFQSRFEKRPQNADEPSSPALPTIRPALAAKLDPFASTTARSADPQMQRLPSAANVSRTGKPKLAIFSDADAPPTVARPGSEDAAKGWDNIGTIAERKKENTIEARPWVGETLKAGKKPGVASKMMVFKDESNANSEAQSFPRATTNSKTGRVELVFANLEAVYPNPKDLSEEYSFEELRAKHRGWLNRKWATVSAPAHVTSQNSEDYTTQLDLQDMTHDITTGDFTASDFTAGGTKKPREHRNGRPRRKRVMEVKGETQTVKLNLDSPAQRKLKRKNSTEPTMTLHTKAANEEMLDIFNAPLGHVNTLGADIESADESDYDTDDYTSGGDSTGTGHISAATSDCGDDHSVRTLGDDTSARSVDDHESRSLVSSTTGPQSVSPWSEFTKSKHIPNLQTDDSQDREEPSETQGTYHTGLESITESTVDNEDEQTDSPEPAAEETMDDTDAEELDFIMPASHSQRQPLVMPPPPEDCHVPTYPYRDAEQIAQSRLPFMTPIVERTECSIPSVEPVVNDYFTAKTPSRRRNEADPALPQIDDLLLSSPFQEIVNEARPERPNLSEQASAKDPYDKPAIPGMWIEESLNIPGVRGDAPLIPDRQCNPLDESIRRVILAHAEPVLSANPTYHYDHHARFNHGPELRRFAKATGRGAKPLANEKVTSPAEPPTLVFPADASVTYTVKRELGKGAFAPVYLATSPVDGEEEPAAVAIKAEDPPSAWEFYLMTLAHQRLGTDRAAASIAQPRALYLFADEGYLIESYHDQGTLLDLSNLSSAESVATGGAGLVDECVAAFFATELLRTMLSLHAMDLLHGDIKADNCLVRLQPVPAGAWGSAYSASGATGWAAKGVTLIDFGRAIDRRAFVPGATFVTDGAATKEDCPAVRAARPWTVHADYWGVAGVIHLLLFGRWMEDVEERGSAATTSTDDHDARPATAAAATRHRIREPFKRYWQTDLWHALFDALMNPAASDPAAAATAALHQLELYLETNAERRGLRASLRRIEERIRETRRKR